MPELCLIKGAMSSSYAALTAVLACACCFSSAAREQPGSFACKAWAFGHFCCRMRERERNANSLEVGLSFRHTTDDLAYPLLGKWSQWGCWGLSSCLQLLYNGQGPVSRRVAELLGWRWCLQFDSSYASTFTLWKAQVSFPGGRSKLQVQFQSTKGN